MIPPSLVSRVVPEVGAAVVELVEDDPDVLVDDRGEMDDALAEDEAVAKEPPNEPDGDARAEDNSGSVTPAIETGRPQCWLTLIAIWEIVLPDSDANPAAGMTQLPQSWTDFTNSSLQTHATVSASGADSPIIEHFCAKTSEPISHHTPCSKEDQGVSANEHEPR